MIRISIVALVLAIAYFKESLFLQLSRSLLKLVDEAIIPALFVFGAKLIGLVVANFWYDLSWDVAGADSSIFPLISYRSQEAFLQANTLSNAFVLAVIFVGFLWVLIRAHAFHGSHISPKLSVALVQKQLTGLVVHSWELYHQAVIWLAYLWLALILFTIQAIYGVSEWWLSIAGTLVALFFSWLLIMDVEKEIAIRREHNEE